MRALIKEGGAVRVASIPDPEPQPLEVALAVDVAGICRTDLDVAEGRRQSRDPVVLGHELAGRIITLGARVTGYKIGEAVTVLPAVSCGLCATCLRGRPLACPAKEMLGVERHGAFAERMVVPARCLLRLPPRLSPVLGACVEPVAAALAVTEAGIAPGDRGMIVGRNRIAALVAAVFRATGLPVPPRIDPRSDPPIDVDFAVETEPTDAALAMMVEAVRPGGRIILKSRAQRAAALPLGRAVEKELTIQAVAYGSFERAIALLTNGLAIEELLGPLHRLEDFPAALAAARADESKKHFFAIIDAARAGRPG
jgi:threonine dehydrogenase-like Zn-dependent dehydrogenase